MKNNTEVVIKLSFHIEMQNTFNYANELVMFFYCKSIAFLMFYMLITTIIFLRRGKL